MKETKGKPLVIITGASSGIGAATAKLFSQAGCPLGLLARNKQAMEALKLRDALCLETDVTDLEQVKTSIKQAEQQFRPVDCLINNAGFAKGGEFSELSHKDHETTFQVNLMGVINTIEVVLSDMQSRRHGTIINVSSVADRHARPNIASYAASKAAVKSLSESLRMANAKYGIRICNVAPAKIKTPLMMKSQLNENQIIPVEDMAKTLLWIYQQPQSICIRDLVIAPTAYEP